jgi:glycosyltransferase involved in cell wall biosynthesis
MKDADISSSAVSWSLNRRDLAGAWRVWRWLREHPADVAHVHHGGVMLRLLCRMAGVSAVVQHVHGRIVESNGDSIAKLNLRAADAVIACSNAVAECFPQGRAEVIYAGLETGARPHAPATSEGPLKLGVLGRLIPLKNVEGLINAVAHLAARGIDVRVEVAGSGPSESSLRELVASLGIADRVRFLGWRVDVDRLLSSWDALVMPSLEEGFPLSALEAMAAARAVVASRVGGLGELVVDGVTGYLLPAGDTGALADCIAELACNRQRLATMGDAGWERAHGLFSAARMAQQTVQVYDRLLSEA